MTKEEFLKELETLSHWKGGDGWQEAFPKMFSDMKKLIGEYSPELLEKVRSKYYDNEQAAELVRAQKTLGEMDAVLYYVDHLTGIYEYSEYKSKGNGKTYSTLFDVGPYEVQDYVLGLLGEKPLDDEDDDDDDEEDE